MLTAKLCPACKNPIPQDLLVCPACKAPQHVGPSPRANLASRPSIGQTYQLSVPQPKLVAAITFCSTASLDLPLTPPEQVRGVSLQLDGGTNGQGALQMAEQLLFGGTVYSRSVVVLLTDGDFTEPDPDPKSAAN